MTINVKVTRDETLRIKVAPDILRRLESLALRFGLPSSTLAAYAVAQWLAQQEQGANVAQAIAKEIGGHAGDVIRQLVEMVDLGQIKEQAASHWCGVEGHAPRPSGHPCTRCDT